jgi:azurin
MNPAPVQHNWVLAMPGQEQAVADAAGSTGGDATGVTGVIATTTVLNANGEETTELPALQAGTYTYIFRTVPGHYAAGMKGTLTVQ